MKSLLTLHEKVTLDMGHLCCVSTTRDSETVARRVEQEGLSFLTITLPSFAKAFERGLENGCVRAGDFPGFKLGKSSCLPAFLRGFTTSVFDSITGVLKDEPSPEAVFAVRQICLSMKKFRASCSLKRVKLAMEQFVLTDVEVGINDCARPRWLEDEFGDHAHYLFKPVLSRLEEDLQRGWCKPVPKHGPGATAERLTSNGKYLSREWTDRLDRFFHFEDYMPTGCDLEPLRFLPPRHERPVRVVSVPKTLKTPRIIGIEPTCMQYVQQGLLEQLVPLLESKQMFNSLGFSDQTLNQRLARAGSLGKGFATLDLSEASDRVSNQLAMCLFKGFPALGARVQACRSRTADVPGEGVLTLSKFATMGSALCFPIEAMVFLTVLFMAWRKASTSVRLSGRESFLKAVRVYGDDIIVPVGMAQSVTSELEAFGLKVNRSKSFWSGNFRESCGGDFYSGVSVKPLYIKTDIPKSRRDVEEMECTVSFRNLAYLNQMTETVSFLDAQIERLAPFPFVSDKSPVLGRLGEDQGVSLGKRFCPNTHRVLVFGMIPRRKSPVDPLEGSGALQKFMLKRGNFPIFTMDHLLRAGRPRSADIRLGWGPA